MGRVSKFTPETVRKILDALQLGCTRKHASQLAGINRDTLLQWIKEHEDFAEQLAEAEAKGVTALIGSVRRAAHEGDWHAAAWLLEHRWPREYGRHVDVHVDGETDNNVHIEIRRFDAYAALREVIDGDAEQATLATPAAPIVEADPEPEPVRTLLIEPVRVEPPPPRHQVEPKPGKPKPAPTVEPARPVLSVAEAIVRGLEDERTRRRNNLDF